MVFIKLRENLSLWKLKVWHPIIKEKNQEYCRLDY